MDTFIGSKRQKHIWLIQHDFQLSQVVYCKSIYRKLQSFMNWCYILFTHAAYDTKCVLYKNTEDVTKIFSLLSASVYLCITHTHERKLCSTPVQKSTLLLVCSVCWGGGFVQKRPLNVWTVNFFSCLYFWSREGLETELQVCATLCPPASFAFLLMCVWDKIKMSN